MSGKGPAVLAIGAAGSLLLWSAVKGKSVSGALRDVIAGKSPARATSVPISGSDGTSPVIANDLAPVSPASAAKNKAIAHTLVLAEGWGNDQWIAFQQIVGEEDASWNPHAVNPSSGAYGIPQALPGSKMASAGPDWRNSALTQLHWMVRYIRDRYKTPVIAQQFHEANGWY